jgi:bacillithiol biosynthesis cysteine-adding enzyme BshC
MNTTAQFITYSQAGAFSKTVTDYIAGYAPLKPFYQHPVSVAGVKAAITQRNLFNTNRALLVTALKKQYSMVTTSAKVTANIEKLLQPNTYTITTAHQPNIFTGHLYFIYKILHTVKMAAFLEKEIQGNYFVPVYYMGSEDADLDELGHVFINGQKYEWLTSQTGAVGRMKVDKALVKLLLEISGQILVEPFGKEIIDLMKSCYQEGVTIEQATFKLVNELFKEYGVVVLLPDNALLKTAFMPLAEKELKEKFSHKAVEETVALFPPEYKIQAGGREINLFWLDDGQRERIVEEEAVFKIQHTKIEFTKAEITAVTNNHPQNFSPNVILRPVFQEIILPNVAFIGGGGELAYWLELKKVFETAAVPLPVLVLRNSFLVVNAEYKALALKLCLTVTDLFKPVHVLLKELVTKESALQLDLEKEIVEMKDLYNRLKKISGMIDASLAGHTEALQTKALHKIEGLQKKMFKAEKRKFEIQQRQLDKLKTALFPANGLQERTENIIPFYAKWGKNFIAELYKHSLAFDAEFAVLEIM